MHFVFAWVYHISIELLIFKCKLISATKDLVSRSVIELFLPLEISIIEYIDLQFIASILQIAITSILKIIIYSKFNPFSSSIFSLISGKYIPKLTVKILAFQINVLVFNVYNIIWNLMNVISFRTKQLI